MYNLKISINRAMILKNTNLHSHQIPHSVFISFSYIGANNGEIWGKFDSWFDWIMQFEINGGIKN